MWTSSSWPSSGCPSNQGMLVERSTTLSPARAEIGTKSRSVISSLAAKLVKSCADLLVDRLVVVDEVHFVDAEDQVRHPQQRGEQGVAAGLFEHAFAGVDQEQRQAGGRGAGDHVARVLDVAGSVGDHELALRRREVAVGDVDRDPLLALGPQAVGQQRQVGLLVAALDRGLLDRAELVFEDRFGVVQEPPDQGRLAVVHRAGGGDPQQLAGTRSNPPSCDPPSPLPRSGRRRGWRRAR